MGDVKGFTQFIERFRSRELRTVAEAWEKSRGDQRFPLWPELEAYFRTPEAAHVWAFDFDGEKAEFTARFAGRNATVGFGNDFRGTRLRDLHPPHVYELAEANFRIIVSEPACCRWSGKLFKVENTIVEGERIILPIGSHDRYADGLFGASSFGYPVTRTPIHFELIHDVAEYCKV